MCVRWLIFEQRLCGKPEIPRLSSDRTGVPSIHFLIYARLPKQKGVITRCTPQKIANVPFRAHPRLPPVRYHA
jgi:hypothetical protein